MMTDEEMKRRLQTTVQLLAMSFRDVQHVTETPNLVMNSFNLQMIGSRKCDLLLEGRVLITASDITDDRSNHHQLLTPGVRNYASRSGNMIQINTPQSNIPNANEEAMSDNKNVHSKISLRNQSTLQPNQRFKL